MDDIPPDNLPPREVGDCYCAAYQLPEPNQTRVISLIDAVENEAFWNLPRKLQVHALLEHRKAFQVSQKDIAVVMGVSPSTVSKYKWDFIQHPDVPFPLPGRPSKIGKVFPQVEAFIHSQWAKGRTRPLGILLEFLADKLNVFVTRKALWQYMVNHGYPYVCGIPTDSLRVMVDRGELWRFYTSSLPAALQGVHPELVFNMDEMGAERYADAKHVHVFVPGDVEHGEGMPIGVPRSSRRVTLIVCIILDGSRLTPAVVIKNVTANSLIFENGYSPENLTLDTTKNSFVTGDVFGDWLKDIFIPYVEEKREHLRRLLGPFDQRAVLILDGCSSHKKEEHRCLLESKNITMVFLVPHSSHLTQPLDLYTFGRVKSYIRDQDTYAVSLEEFDEALDDVLDQTERV